MLREVNKSLDYLLNEDTEIADIDLDIRGQVKPPKNNKVALIDADTLAYTVCLNTEVVIEVLNEAFYTSEEWQEILDNPGYVSEESIIYESSPVLALAKAKEKIDRILDKTGCQEAELHFTSGRNNFRYQLSPNYKANRTGRIPAGLAELKQNLLTMYKGEIHTKIEADDAVVYLAKTRPDKYILCAVDKDVLNSLVGMHLNYYESVIHSKEMSLVVIDSETARIWPYLQTLMGDKTDNILGLKGIGPAKANKILYGCDTELKLWKAVVKAYASHNRPESDALLNMNLVNMHLVQDDDYSIKLWEAPREVIS